MYFNQTLNNVSQKYFFLTVWNHNSQDNCPGSIIYSQIGVRPEYGDSLNDFRTYLIDTSQVLIVPDTFYVGWIQTTTDLLNVGLDRNRLMNDSNIAGWKNPKIFYNISGAWQNSSVEGALMIRPLFGMKLDPNNITTPESHPEFSLFPNPAKDIINISYPEATGNGLWDITINDLPGKAIMHYNNPVSSLSVSSLKNGVYFIRIIKDRQIQYTGKFIILR